MYRKQVRRRRAVLFALVAVSLTFLSLYFQEGSGGPLHRIQRVVATVLGPIEEGASRALKPARDTVNWFSETFDAKGENEELRAEVTDLRDRLAQAETTLQQRQELAKLIEVSGGIVPPGEETVTGRVIARSPTVWYSTVTIDKGTSSGVRVDDPVVAADGLAGKVTETTRGNSQVTLITDPNSSVTARVLPGGSTGVVEPNVGDPRDLTLNFIQRGEDITDGQLVVTAGFSAGDLSSLFPPGIPIGKVTESSLEEQQAYQRIHLRAFADLRDMDFVQVIVEAGGQK